MQLRRISVVVLAALMVCCWSGDAPAQYLGNNSIGIYAQPDPQFNTNQEWLNLTCMEDFTGGSFTLYVVLKDPWSDPLDQAITQVGGYEFRIEWPLDYFITPNLPSFTTNFLTAPDFLCGANIPVMGNGAVLMSLSCGAFTGDPREFFITPISNPAQQTIPGGLAITDANDNFTITRAYPASGSYEIPVYRIGNCESIQPQTTWDLGITAMGSIANVVGVAPQATDGYDAGVDLFDADNTVTFLRPEWQQADDEFSTDIRAEYDPLSEIKSWPFRVNVPEQSGTVATVDVRFYPGFTEASGYRLRLEDLVTGQVSELWPDLEYTYISEGGPRDFVLSVGDRDDSFAIDWSATNPYRSDADNRVGTHENGTPGYDAGLDIPSPTPPPTDFLSASTERPGWVIGPRFDRDLQDLYDPLTDMRTWPLLVETDQSGEVELRFQPNFGAADGVSVMLRDEQSGETYSLYPSLTYHFTPTASLRYRFTLIVGGTPMPDLSPAAQYVPAGWSLLGPPLTPEPGGTVDSVVLDQVPGYGYAFAFSTSSQSYLRLDGPEPVSPGNGFWLATDTGFTWTMTGTRDEEPAVVPLGEGWNLVGYPLWFPGPVEGVRVSRGGQELGWSAALSMGWVSAFMTYSQGLDDYSDTLGLEAWHGYWIAAQLPGTNLVFDWRNFVAMPARLSEPKDLPLPPEKDWRCLLVMDDGSGKQRSVTVGVNEDATDGYDATWDRPRPPASPSGGATITLVRDEWDEKPWLRTLSQDIMAPMKEDPVHWTVRLTTDKPGTVDLTWHRLGWPEDLDFQLYLPGDNRVVVGSMRHTGGVTLEVGDRPLDVVVRTPNELSGVGGVPFAGYDVTVRPNPFNPRATVAFNLPRDGKVALQVYDVRGRLVAEIDGGAMAAGRGSLDWQGRDRHGRGAASGVYFARLLLDGAPVGEVARMSLVR